MIKDKKNEILKGTAYGFFCDFPQKKAKRKITNMKTENKKWGPCFALLRGQLKIESEA